MPSSIWGTKYMAGGVTGFTAGSVAYTIGDWRGLLCALSVITLSLMWYHTGRVSANEKHLENLRELKHLATGGTDA